MDIAGAVAFARVNHRSVLTTLRADGGPQLSPVVHGVDDDSRLLVSTREPSVKVRNLRRHPRAWACLLSDGFFGDWAQIEGPCEIVPLPEAMPLLELVYRQVQGEHPDWEEFRAAMRAQRRAVLRLTPDRAGPNVSG